MNDEQNTLNTNDNCEENFWEKHQEDQDYEVNRSFDRKISTGNDYVDNFEQHDNKEQVHKSNNPQNLAPHNLTSTSRVDINKGNTHLNEHFTCNVDNSAQKLEEYLKSGFNRNNWQFKNTLVLDRLEVEEGHLSAYVNLINKSFPDCSLVVLNSQKNSKRKKKSCAPIRWCLGECSDETCKLTFKLLIFCTEFEKVESFVVYKGVIASHHQPPTKLQGYQRYEVGKKIASGIKPTKKHFEMIGNLDPGVELEKRKPLVPSKDVLRRSAYEIRQRSKIGENPLESLITLQKTLVETDVHSEVMRGFVQHCDVANDFYVLHNESQMKASADATVQHMDSTGGVISGGKKFLLFSLCIKQEEMHPIAVSSCLTASQTTDDVKKFLDQKKRNFKEVNGFEWQPEVIVSDFSFPIINGTIKSFSLGSLTDYLDSLYDGEAKPLAIKLCHVHMARQVQRKVKAFHGTNRRVRDTYLTMFRRMMHSTEVAERDGYFRKLCVLSLCREMQAEVEIIMADREPVPFYDEDDVQIEFEAAKNTGTTYRSRTKYGRYFEEIANNIKSKFEIENSSVVSDTLNPNYCPGIIEYFLTYVMPFAPLWSASNLGLYSNSPVENLFGAYKRYHLDGKSDVATFVEEMNSICLSRTLPYLLSKKTSNKKKIKRSSSKNDQEKWSRSRRCKTPYILRKLPWYYNLGKLAKKVSKPGDKVSKTKKTKNGTESDTPSSDSSMSLPDIACASSPHIPKDSHSTKIDIMRSRNLSQQETVDSSLPLDTKDSTDDNLFSNINENKLLNDDSSVSLPDITGVDYGHAPEDCSPNQIDISENKATSQQEPSSLSRGSLSNDCFVDENVSTSQQEHVKTGTNKVVQKTDQGMIKTSLCLANTSRRRDTKRKLTISNIRLTDKLKENFQKAPNWVTDEPLDKYLDVLQDSTGLINFLPVHSIFSSGMQVPKHFATVLNLEQKHWVTVRGQVSEEGNVKIDIYDPLYWKEEDNQVKYSPLIKSSLKKFLKNNGFKKEKNVVFHRLEHQEDGHSCGLHCMAYVYMLAHKKDPTRNKLKFQNKSEEENLRKFYLKLIHRETEVSSLENYIKEVETFDEHVRHDI